MLSNLALTASIIAAMGFLFFLWWPLILLLIAVLTGSLAYVTSDIEKATQ